MQQWGNVLGGDDTVRQLYFDGRSTPPRPPPPPPTSQYGREGQFLRVTPRDGAVRAQNGHPQFPHTYVNRNPLTTPPHPTSTSWASQLATPQMSPSWSANGSSLFAPIAPYDPQIEEARLHQAVTLGTSFGTTLMQSSSGFSHPSIQAACYARQQQLQGTIGRFPLISRPEFHQMSSAYTLINPLGASEPFGNKNLYKQLTRSIDSSIELERKNSPNGTINLNLLGMPGQATHEYMQQVKQAWTIVTRGMLQKIVIGALTNNLVVMLESKGEIQGAGLRAIFNAPIGQHAIELVSCFSPAHVSIFKYLTETATTEILFVGESQYECVTRVIFNGLAPFLHRTVAERLSLEAASAAKLIPIQSLLWNLLLAPNTPLQQNGQRMHAVNEVNLPLPDMPIPDLKTIVCDRELSYLLAHGVQPHPTDSAKYEWIKSILPKKYLPVLSSLEAVAIGTRTGSHPYTYAQFVDDA